LKGKTDSAEKTSAMPNGGAATPGGLMSLRGPKDQNWPAPMFCEALKGGRAYLRTTGDTINPAGCRTVSGAKAKHVKKPARFGAGGEGGGRGQP